MRTYLATSRSHTHTRTRMSVRLKTARPPINISTGIKGEEEEEENADILSLLLLLLLSFLLNTIEIDSTKCGMRVEINQTTHFFFFSHSKVVPTTIYVYRSICVYSTYNSWVY